MLDSLFPKIHFDRKPSKNSSEILVDMHTNLLPYLDDGSESIEQSLYISRELSKLGYKKVIATPHIMPGFYNNTTNKIQDSLNILKAELSKNAVEIDIIAAAEYYLDDDLIQKLDNGDVLLTLDASKKYLLFETSLVAKPKNLYEAILKMKKNGYTPVLAHPERYLYLQKDFETVLRLANNEVLFQISLNSLTGFYSKPTQLLAETLIHQKKVSFISTDCQNRHQVDKLNLMQQSPYFQLLLKQNLLNNSLLKPEYALA